MSFLSCFQREQITLQPVILNFGMEFIDVVAKTQQKNLQFYLGFPTEQKSLEIIIIFQHPKGAFYLDGTIHTIPGSRFAHDVFVGKLSLADKVLLNDAPFLAGHSTKMQRLNVHTYRLR